MPTRESVPDLSVIVTVVDGPQSLRACLDGLARQTGDVALEVMVPFDHVTAEIGALADDYPDVRFLDLGPLAGGLLPKDPLELHYLWELRRAKAIKAANGRLIGMLHDRGIPAETWAKTLVDMHTETPAAGIGGCVDNGIDTPWHWGVHFYDFGRYMPPMQTQDAAHLSITNLAYDAAKLRALGPLIEDRFREVLVHEALTEMGERLILTDRAITFEMRARGSTRDLIKEWAFWGTKYARLRSETAPLAQRVVRTLTAPLVPVVLFLRQLQVQRKKKVHMKRFWPAAPTLMLVVTAWAAGEAVGYVTGPKAKP